MRIAMILVILLVGLAAACTNLSSTRPVETLDERTGMTVGALKEPIELMPSARDAAIVSGKHLSFAYLGPVEWNRSGTVSYGLWVHIVPGIDRQPGDIHEPGALTLVLEDGPLDLQLTEEPKLGRAPYRQVASWGQTAYFALTAQGLRRMAASPTLKLDVRAADGSKMSFSPTVNSSAVLTQYVQARGVTGD
jgi:hypothetical protein